MRIELAALATAGWVAYSSSSLYGHKSDVRTVCVRGGGKKLARFDSGVVVAVEGMRVFYPLVFVLMGQD